MGWSDEAGAVLSFSAHPRRHLPNLLRLGYGMDRRMKRKNNFANMYRWSGPTKLIGNPNPASSRLNSGTTSLSFVA